MTAPTLPPEPYREITSPPQDGFVTVNGLRFHYLDWGGDAKTNILFVHGFGLNAHTWDTVCDLLRDDYRCVALDLRGHGDTEWSPTADYKVGSLRDDVAGVAEQLNLGKFILVGMSLGGMTSLSYAGTNSHTLLGLVMVDIGPRAPGRQVAESQGGQRIRAFAAADREMDSVEDFIERAMAFNPLRSREHLRRSLMFNLRQTPEGKWTWKYDPAMQERRMTDDPERQQERLWEHVAAVSVPALVVKGALSDILHELDAEAMAKTFKRGRWVSVEGAGHTVQGDRPHALTKELRAFFEEHSLV